MYLMKYFFRNVPNPISRKANKFYMLDLTVNPDRFDSWAGMALNRMSKVESKLNSVSNELYYFIVVQCISISYDKMILIYF